MITPHNTPFFQAFFIEDERKKAADEDRWEEVIGGKLCLSRKKWVKNDIKNDVKTQKRKDKPCKKKQFFQRVLSN